jgi:hypothetical protein
MALVKQKKIPTVFGQKQPKNSQNFPKSETFSE